MPDPSRSSRAIPARRWTLALACVIALVTVAPPATAERGDPAVTKRETTLRAKRSVSSTRLETLAEGAGIRVTGMSGRWLRVVAGSGKKGWLRSDDVRMGSGGSGGGGGGAGWLRNVTGWLQPGRQSSQTSAVTVGVRGLQREDIEGSTPNLAALSALEAWPSRREDAIRRAGGAKLRAREVAYLDAASASRTSGGSSSGSQDDVDR